jgi:hypothetical protein
MNIIIVPKKDFIDRKAGYCKSSCIEQKYDNLFKKYECFLKSINIYYHKNSKQPEKKKTSYYKDRPLKDSKKSLQCFWNILNESNYQKIIHKLKFQVNDDNAKAISDDIIKNAVIHCSYRRYFILILKEIMNMTNKEFVTDTIERYFQSYINNELYIYKLDDKIQSSYDIFCEQQKHKQKTLSTNTLLFDIVKAIPSLNINVDEYINKILFNLEVDLNDEYHVDLYLHMIMDLLKYNNDISRYTIINWDIIADNIISLKNKFLIDKVKITLRKVLENPELHCQ